MEVAEALEVFLTGIRTEVGSKETIAWYRKRLKRMVTFLDGKTLQNVTLDDLRRFIATLYDQSTLYAKHPYHKPVNGKLSIAYIHSYVRAIKSFYAWLVENEYLDAGANAAAKLKKPKLPRTPPKAITDTNMAAMLKAAKKYGKYGKRNYAILCLLGETGCRMGGLVKMKVSDVDLDKGRIMVTEKGNKSRTVFIGSMAKRALGAWLAVRPDETDYLFPGERGVLTEWGVRMLLKHVGKAANVKGKINAHAWRHAYARRHLLRGGDIGILSDLMGHSDIKVTKEAYSIFEIDELQKKHTEFSSLDGLLT